MTKPGRREFERKPSRYFDKDDSPAVTTGAVKYAFQGNRFIFETGTGIFSKEGIDTGSEIMLLEFCKHEHPRSGATILDLGCGYGFIGIVLAATFPGTRVDLVEINPKASKFAQRNASSNGIAGFTLYTLDFTSDDEQKALGGKHYDYILCNPPVRAGKETMERMISGAIVRLTGTGTFYIVIKTSLGAKSWQAWFDNNKAVTMQLFRKGGYRIFKINLNTETVKNG
nr:methyltransferase [Candidatus Sigynarchaeota archaeon]